MFDSLFPSHWTTLRKLMWLKLKGASAVWDTITGNPVSFTAKAAPLRQLKVAFSPKQDLHGYDSPWPAGGGKNKFQVTATTQTINDVVFTVYSDGSVNVNGTASANAVFVLNSFDFDGEGWILNGCPAGGSSSTYKLDAFGTSGLSEDVGSGVTISTSGTRNIRIVVFSGTNVSNKLFKPMLRSSSVADSAFSPYSNLCPISGWSEVTVEQRGKNLLTATLEQGGFDSSTGEDTAASNRVRSDYISVKPNTKYTVSLAAYDTFRIRFVGLYGGTFEAKSVDQGVPYTFTTGADTTSIRVMFARNTNLALSPSDMDNCGRQLELGSTATSYTPYNPSSRSISISLGSTVYSGTLDVVTGVLTVDWAKVTLDGSQTQQNSKYDGTYNAIARWNLSVPAKTVPSATSVPNALSDKLRVIGVSFVGSFAVWANDESLGFTFTLSQDGTRVGIAIPKSEGITSAATMNTWLSNNPVTVAYELATPIPIQLTPQEVQSLLGVNNMWSTANGNLTVEYRSN